MVEGRRARPGSGRRGRTLDERLSREDWAEAALKVLVEDGIGAINVLGLSRRLGVARGSFYWHFKNRAELLETALELWERRATYEYIERLERLGDPRQRLDTLILRAFADAEAGRMFTALSGATSEPRVGRAIARALRARLVFIRRTYRQLGFSGAQASHRAALLNEVYLGLWQVDRVCPFADKALDSRLSMKAHLRFIRDLLLADREG